MKLELLKEREDNFRNHNERQIEELIKSVEMFGQIRPIVIDEKNEILAGHGLYRALLEMGRTEAEVLQVKDLTEGQKKKLMLADNKIYELGTTDTDIMIKLINDIKEVDNESLNIPGFEEEVLELLTAVEFDIDESLESYGELTDEKVEEMKQETVIAPTKQEVYLDEEKIQIKQDKPTDVPKPFVKCDHCGEKVWL